MTAPLNVERLVSGRLVVGSSILVVEHVLRLGMVAAVSVWIAHHLGPAQFGLLNYASALVAIFWSAALLGLDTPLTARLATSRQPGLFLGSAFALRTVTGVLGGLLALGSVFVLRAGEHDAVLLTAIVALAVPLSAPLVVDAWFKAVNDALAPALARLVATLVSSAAKITCLLLDGGVVALAWTVALEALLVSVALLLAYWVRAPKGAANLLTVQGAQMTGMLRESWPFLLSGLAVAAYMKIDVVMLGAMSTNEQTGLYSLSQKLCEVVYFVPVVVVDVLFPQLVRHQAAHGHTSSSQVFFDIAFASALFATVLSVGLVVLLLPAVFGEPYAPTVSIFVVHVMACFGVALGHARLKWMAATGRQAIAPWVAFLGLIIAVALHAALIPPFGAMGAAAATALAFTASAWWASYLFPGLRMAARMQTRALWPWARLYLDWRQWRADSAAIRGPA